MSGAQVHCIPDRRHRLVRARRRRNICPPSRVDACYACHRRAAVILAEFGYAVVHLTALADRVRASLVVILVAAQYISVYFDVSCTPLYFMWSRVRAY